MNTIKKPETLFHAFLQTVDRNKNNNAFIYKSADDELKTVVFFLFLITDMLGL
jgi:hypothetical protein